MGICECENNSVNNKELKYFFTRTIRDTVKAQAENDFSNKKETKKKKRIIKNFINKNISRLVKKEKYNNLKNKAQSLFFDNEELNFIYNEQYFEEKINSKLDEFINTKEKENIVKDLFTFNLKLTKHSFSFQKLKDKVSIHYNNDILNNHKKYFNDLISFLNKKNPIYENENIIKKIYLKFNDKNENEITNKRNNEFEENKKNNIEDIQKEKFNLSSDPMNIKNFIKREINNFFDVCLTKKNFVECQKKSIFLNIILSLDNQKYPQINFPWELRKLLRLLYYIYLLKKYNFLNNTNNCFYKINPIQIKRKSKIMDKILLKKRESITKNENMFKMKLFKKAITRKNITDSIIPIESNIADSMSSILSEEDEKESYSLVSANNDFKLLKSMTKNESQINKIRMEEEKVNDNKSELGLLSNFNNKDKNSYPEKLKKKNNLKLDNQIRINQRTKTANKNKGIIFTEYYNGQFDETIYLYAGIGTLVSQNKNNLYHGTFRYGRKEGMGILYQIKDDQNMDYYMGEFHENKIDGYGIRIKIFETQLIFQEGIFQSENFMQGTYKKIKQKDNRIFTINYEGDFKDNKFTGSTKLFEKKYVYKENEKKYILVQELDYIGEFKNGKKHGQGKEILNKVMEQNKNYDYEGNFVNGLKDGFGIINYDKNNFVTRYEGFFEKDKPFQYYGIVNFKSGDIYEGFLKNNIKDYLGLYSFYKSKKIIEIYFGGFLKDSKNGLGKTIVEEKEEKMLIGTYNRGEKEGQFEKIHFKNDIIVKAKERKGCVISNDLIPLHINKKEKLPKLQIKSYPVYEENDIIDFNDNYFFED